MNEIKSDRTTYSEEEVRAILHQALEIEQHAEPFAWDDLEAMAHELQISPTALQAAAASWREAQTAAHMHAEGPRMASNEPLPRAGFFFAPLAFVLLFILMVNIATGGGFWWLIFPTLAIGFRRMARAPRRSRQQTEYHGGEGVPYEQADALAPARSAKRPMVRENRRCMRSFLWA
ncbi:MAG: hypothetical protein KDD73_04225 [Anaerolineales bacterium]|nr:hypothetical protein [Anaerolineales bacterium]